MKTKLIKSVFSDDPEIMALMGVRDQEELIKKVNDLPQSETALLIRGPKGETGDKPSSQELVDLIEPLIPAPIPGEKGDDGHTPSKEELRALIKPLIPQPLKGDKGDSATPTHTTEVIKQELTLTADIVKEIVQLMRKLPEKDRLEIQDIRNSNSFIFGGNKYKIEELMHGGSGPTPSGSLVFTYDISSQFDSVKTTFTLPTYYSILSVTFTGWPPEGNLRPTVDFTTPTSTTIALTAQVTAPPSGTTGIVLYTV